MNKNMRTWVIGICVALVIIVAVAAAFANNRSGSDDGQTSQSQTESTSASAASQTETETGSREQASSNSGNAADHSGHNGHMNASGDDLSRYLTEQDSIMMNMMEDMVIREKSGNASLDFLRGMIPHHEAAIKMSESYLNYQGKSDELKTIAQDIITAQKDELKPVSYTHLDVYKRQVYTSSFLISNTHASRKFPCISIVTVICAVRYVWNNGRSTASVSSLFAPAREDWLSYTPARLCNKFIC